MTPRFIPRAPLTLALTLLALGIPGQAAAAAKETERVERTVALAAGGTLTLKNFSGRVEITGEPRQATVVAYQTGAGLTELLIPTNGALMAILLAAGIPYPTWLAFASRGFMLLLAVPCITAFRLAFRERKSLGGELLLGTGMALVANMAHNMYEFAVHEVWVQSLLFVNLGIIAAEVRHRRLAARARVKRQPAAATGVRPPNPVMPEPRGALRRTGTAQ